MRSGSPLTPSIPAPSQIAQQFLHLPAKAVISSDAASWDNVQLALFHQPPHRIPEHVSPYQTIGINAGIKPVEVTDFTLVKITDFTLVKITDFTLVKIKKKKIIAWWYTCNLLSVLEQMGVVSPASKEHRHASMLNAGTFRPPIDKTVFSAQ